ncbi:F-box plant-like protein, putative [Medicago truncatula]|uniref:F-box plant-like protein, putative n=1 Tax=Medicago truncatula TaxID=3880 RepID=A0A072V4I2_MEDTR|nr:F-box plant-like protein, putative [Medicago truncatula]
MVCLQISAAANLCSLRTVNAAIHLPKLPSLSNLSIPQLSKTRKLIEEFNGSKDQIERNNNVVLTTQSHDELYRQNNKKSNAIIKLYAILEAVSDRVEMHQNIGEQRNNWNTLLLNSINMITLTATTMSGVAATAAATCSDSSLLALKLSSALLFSAATGLLLIMNKIQPSQLAEEQRNATRLFKQLQSHIKTTIAIGNPTEEDVKDAMEKVLAIDKAYPLPLLGAMLEKYPSKFEPANWWPMSKKVKTQSKKMGKMNNGWSKELEMEMREVVEVIKRKDAEDYDRLGNIALKVNKSLAIAGPLLTGIAAIGSTFVGSGSLAAFVPLLAGSLASVINTFEHGGQVGMVFEMYRASGGFFNLIETSIDSTLGEKDLEKRENGELFEMKMALQLGRSVSELRELASKSASCRMEGIEIDEFASKLF